MTIRTAFETVADGDQLNQDFFNEIGEFYIEHTDTNAAAYTTSATIPTLATAIRFTGFATTDCIKGIWLKNSNLKTSNTGTRADVHIELTDGVSKTYAFMSPVAPGNVENCPLGYIVGTAVSTMGAWSTYSDAYKERNWNIYLPGDPTVMTGTAGWTVNVKLMNTSGAQTTTFQNGFKVQLFLTRHDTILGTAP